MNQNVFGVILFSVIVGTAIFISKLFAVGQMPPTIYETRAVPTYSERSSSCHKSKVVVSQTTPIGSANIKVIQAVLNQQTRQLETEYLIKRENRQTEAVGIALHFFTKNGAKTRYLATQTVTVTPDFDYNDKASHAVTSSYKWLDDLKQQDNLYVIAEQSSSFNRSKSLEPMFDEAKATAVLLDKGK